MSVNLCWAVIAGIITVNLLRAWVLEAAPDFAGVQLEPQTIEIMDLREGEIRDVMFRVSNHSAERQNLRVWGSCACTVPDVGEVSLVAGESKDFRVVVDTVKAPGGNQAWIFVDSQSGQRVAQGSVRFASVREFVVNPTALLCGVGEEGACRVAFLAPDFSGGRALSVDVHDEDLIASATWIGERVVEVRAVARPACRVGEHEILLRVSGTDMATVPVGVRGRSPLVARGVPRKRVDGGWGVSVQLRKGWVVEACNQILKDGNERHLSVLPNTADIFEIVVPSEMDARGLKARLLLRHDDLLHAVEVN